MSNVKYTKEQTEQLLKATDECQRMGVTSKQLAPIFALILCRKPEFISEAARAYAKTLKGVK